MPALLFALAQIVALATVANSADDIELIQSHFFEQKAGSRNETSDENVPRLFKVTYLSTHGSDHACLTEMQFLNANRQPMQARFQEMSSCYGCPVKCEECSVDWGDASRQFDLVSNNNDGSAWSCTGVGSFVNGGQARDSKPHVTFSLERRPAKVVFAMAQVGDWAPKTWMMQEYNHETAKWETIAQVSDAAADFEQPFFVEAIGSAENPAKWPIDYSLCGGKSLSLIDVVPSVDPPSMSAAFTPQTNRVMSNSGQFDFDSGNEMAIAGEFGTISIDGTAYEIRQFTINFPSNHKSPNGVQADGEMHIIMQKTGSQGIFDLAVVDILLLLKEETAEQDATVNFFLGLGLENLPRQGEPKYINGTVDMSAFQSHFSAGSVMKLQCSEFTPWYVLGEPAYITGTIKQAFLDGPPTATPAPTFFNQTLVNMSAEQRALAMEKAGFNPDGSLKEDGPSAELAARIAAGPSASAAAAAIAEGPSASAAAAETAQA